MAPAVTFQFLSSICVELTTGDSILKQTEWFSVCTQNLSKVPVQLFA